LLGLIKRNRYCSEYGRSNESCCDHAHLFHGVILAKNATYNARILEPCLIQVKSNNIKRHEQYRACVLAPPRSTKVELSFASQPTTNVKPSSNRDAWTNSLIRFHWTYGCYWNVNNCGTSMENLSTFVHRCY
jgi:hypothetical protein